MQLRKFPGQSHVPQIWKGEAPADRSSLEKSGSAGASPSVILHTFALGTSLGMAPARTAACGFANDGTVLVRIPDEDRTFVREAASGDWSRITRRRPATNKKPVDRPPVVRDTSPMESLQTTPASIEIRLGPATPMRRELQARTQIGRSASADLPLDHVSVSRKHAELLPLAEGGWLLKNWAAAMEPA